MCVCLQLHIACSTIYIDHITGYIDGIESRFFEMQKLASYHHYLQISQMTLCGFTGHKPRLPGLLTAKGQVYFI